MIIENRIASERAHPVMSEFTKQSDLQQHFISLMANSYLETFSG